MQGDRTTRAQLSWQNMLPPSLLALAALTLRLWHLDYDSIWLDEAMSAYHSSLPSKYLWKKAIVNKPPLYYHITTLFWSPGNGAFALRLPAAIFGAVTVFLSWYLGKALAGTKGAALLALFVLLSPLNIQYSQEARHYTLLTVGWLLVILALFRLVESAQQPKPPIRFLAALGVGIMLMIQTHPIAWIYLVAAAASYVTAQALPGHLTRPNLLHPLWACLLACLTLLPWLPSILKLANGAHHFNWLEQPSSEMALDDFLQLFGSNWLAVMGLTGLLLYWVRHRLSEGVLLLGLSLLPPLLIWLAGFIMPMYMLRTIMPGHVLALAGIVLLITTLRGRWLGVAASLLVVCSLTTSSYRQLTTPNKEDWRSLSQQLLSQSNPTDVVLLCEPYLYYPLWFYQGNGLLPTYVIKTTGDDQVSLSNVMHLKWSQCLDGTCAPFYQQSQPGQRKVIWAVDGGGGPPCASTQIQASLLKLTGQEYLPQSAWQGHKVQLTPYVLAD